MKTWSKEEFKNVKKHIFCKGLETFCKCYDELGKDMFSRYEIFTMMKGWCIGFVGLGFIDLKQAHEFLDKYMEENSKTLAEMAGWFTVDEK